ncbi:MAG TPA: DUF2764 family protein [Spirochaetota bacterium]|nr:DUF2764 family protein [Spirochaetota bacterium]
MKQYYYLVSSLYELIIDGGKGRFSLEDFLDLCESQLDESDLSDLRSTFLFNDIKNAVNYKKKGDRYLSPAFYDEEDFLENLKDTDSFLPFLSDFFYNRINNKKNDTRLNEVDYLTLLFYENLELLSSDFIKNYFLFELDLKNITVALSLRKNGAEYKDKIIPYGDYYERILKNNAPDFGLLNEFPFIEKLLSVYEKNHLVEIEKTIEEIRWDYLDEASEDGHFGLNNVLSYAIKFRSIQRWLSLSKEKGEELFNRLIEQIKGNIAFPNEFR